MSTRFPVVLTKEVCPVCAKQIDGPILLGRTATSLKEGQHHVDKLHGQVIGMSDTLCKECKDMIGENVWVAVYDGSKTDDRNETFNPYRCGIMVGIKREAIERMFYDHPGLETFLKRHFLFMDYIDAGRVGIDVSSYIATL